MFEVSRLTNKPNWMPESVNNMRVLPSNTFDTLNDLFSRFSRPVERARLGFNYTSALGEEVNDHPWDGGERNLEARPTRSLGVWDQTWSAPTFPLPAELQAARWISANGPPNIEFIRFADRGDFQNLDQSYSEYMRVLGRRFPSLGSDGDLINLSDLGNLALMQHLDGGAVDGFLPIFASNQGGCGSLDNIGILFDPPALFVDVAIFENSGTGSLVIDDILGEVDSRRALRPYSNANARDLAPLGQGSITLAPGESVMMVQRLLFRSLSEQLPNSGAKGAVYGPTALPTGVIVGGRQVALDGRSHNSLILVSYLPETCCPFLDYWCVHREEWVSLGNVIGGAEGKDKITTEVLEFDGFVGTFQLSEHEAEMSLILDFHICVTLENLDQVTIRPKIDKFPARIDFLEKMLFEFDLPTDLRLKDITSTKISICGYYAKFSSSERGKISSNQVIAQT